MSSRFWAGNREEGQRKEIVEGVGGVGDCMLVVMGGEGRRRVYGGYEMEI